MSGFLYGGYTAFMTQGHGNPGMGRLLWWNPGVAAGLFCIRTGFYAVCSRCGSKRRLFRSMDSSSTQRSSEEDWVTSEDPENKAGQNPDRGSDHRWTDCFYSLCSWSADGGIHHRSDRSTECGNRRDHRKNDLQQPLTKGHGWRYRALLRSSSSDPEAQA